jgi:diguanylate cyclase (GGDEF)-like protein
MMAATSVAADILLADERLTMSANLAAKSGERQWIDRYNSFIPDIDKAISNATSMASPENAERFERETKLANDALVSLEAQSFQAVQAGDLDRAGTILKSEEYSNQKEILATGTRHLLESVISAAKSRLDSVQLIGRIALFLLGTLSALGFALFWLLTERRIRASERRHLTAETQLNFMAQHDELTSLPNRHTFLELLAELIEGREASSDGCVAVAMVDVDHFKDINDTLGHSCGDELIKALPERFAWGLPPGAVLSRFGGDEFAIALKVRSEQEARGTFGTLVECLSEPFTVDGHLLSISISVGVAISPEHTSTPNELLRFADIALYEAKAQGRNRMHMFTAILDELQRERMHIESDLRAALELHEFALDYQPLFSQDGTRITGLEGLLRWDHSQHGAVPASRLIPIAEHSGLIVPIGEWVIRRAFDDSFRWPELRIAIKLSPVQLRDPGFFDSLHKVLSDTHVDPRRFEFEITEGVLLEGNHRVHKLLGHLHELGFSISLDAFGTGYTSLSFLRNLPFSRLKIDQSFIRQIEVSEEGARIVQSMVILGQALGLDVAAEGVESIGQLQFLEAVGCQQIQGPFLARTQNRDEISRLLSKAEVRHSSEPT